MSAVSDSTIMSPDDRKDNVENLNDLPAEIHKNILDHLDSVEDHRSLRLVSKLWDAHLRIDGVVPDLRSSIKNGVFILEEPRSPLGKRPFCIMAVRVEMETGSGSGSGSETEGDSVTETNSGTETHESEPESEPKSESDDKKKNKRKIIIDAYIPVFMKGSEEIEPLDLVISGNDLRLEREGRRDWKDRNVKFDVLNIDYDTICRGNMVKAKPVSFFISLLYILST